MNTNERNYLVAKAEILAKKCWKNTETEQAIQVEFKILELDPIHANSINRLAVHFLSTENYRKAEVVLEHAIKHGVKTSNVYLLISELLIKTGNFAKGLEFSLNSLKLEKTALASVNASICFSKLGMLIRSLEFAEQALDLDSDNYKALLQLGYLHRNLGDISKAIKYTKKSLDVAPKDDWSKVYSNLLFFLSMDANCSNEAYLQKAIGFGDGLNVSKYSKWNVKDNKRLRIGFVSGDYREHAVAKFLLDSLTALKKYDLDLVAYSSFRYEDKVTAKFKGLFNEWYLLDGLADVEAAARIHKDRINILIDVSGHTAHNRLPVFARKPAPIQVSWLGYFASTGLQEMDYFLRDRFSAPDGFQSQFVEKIWSIDYTQCFSQPDFDVEIKDFPFFKNGYVTFGCFHTVAKVTDDMIAVWVKILSEVPNSKLYLKSKLFGTREGQNVWIEKFSKYEVSEDRLILDLPRDDRSEYLDCFNQVDIALDTFPFTGATVSVETLWMGVPYISLVGNTVISRMGASMLAAAGLNDYLAETQDEYVDKAVSLASGISDLSGKRKEIRELAVNSLLFDQDNMAQNLYESFQQMWEVYFEGVG